MLDTLLVSPNSSFSGMISPDFPFNPSTLDHNMSSAPSSTQVTPTKSEDISQPSLDLPFSYDDDLDHRKRRRNRTTQSCWSCHQAKRKCDRKRPCSRCIQLGLTGLCVYETDDPSARDDPTMSETQRLRKRIAELEALVREMKNKPHPRWADKVSPGGVGLGSATTAGGVDKWHTRAKYASSSAAAAASAGGGGGPSSSAGPDGFDDYQYRFPPLDGSGSSSTYDSATTMDDLTAGRRLSIASSSQSSSNSSPRTPYYSPLTGASHSHNFASSSSSQSLSTNPCSCLTTSPTLARALSSSIRSILFDAGSSLHPYTDACRVLSLVRELEQIAATTASSSAAAAAAESSFYAASPGSGTNSPSPSSLAPISHHHHHPAAHHAHPHHPHPHAHQHPHLPHPHSQQQQQPQQQHYPPPHPHLSRPPTLSYASYPTLSSLTMATYQNGGGGSNSGSAGNSTSGGGGAGPQQQQHSYTSPSSDDGRSDAFSMAV